MAYFVYVSGKNGEPEPQRFDEWPTVDGKPLKTLQYTEISGRDLACRLAYLVKKFPYKG